MPFYFAWILRNCKSDSRFVAKFFVIYPLFLSARYLVFTYIFGRSFEYFACHKIKVMASSECVGETPVNEILFAHLGA